MQHLDDLRCTIAWSNKSKLLLRFYLKNSSGLTSFDYHTWVFLVYDKLLRCLLRSTFVSHVWIVKQIFIIHTNYKTWHKLGGIVRLCHPTAWCLVPLLSMNCVFKWHCDSLYLISLKVDQSSPSADILNKSDGWTVILKFRKISCFIFSCNIHVWIFNMSIYHITFSVHKYWLSCIWRLSYQVYSCISWSQYLTFRS